MININDYILEKLKIGKDTEDEGLFKVGQRCLFIRKSRTLDESEDKYLYVDAVTIVETHKTVGGNEIKLYGETNFLRNRSGDLYFYTNKKTDDMSIYPYQQNPEGVLINNKKTCNEILELLSNRKGIVFKDLLSGKVTKRSYNVVKRYNNTYNNSDTMLNGDDINILKKAYEAD